MTDESKPLVLVTGGSGFIGAHCLLALISTSSYRLRTTVRSLSKSDFVKSQLKVGGASDDSINAVEIVAANLDKDDGWEAAVAGCTYVHHVASPFPPKAPKHEDELVIPAREGTLRVLRAAKKAGVRRVVITSSVAAVGYGHKEIFRTFTEEDWSITDGDIPPYPKSKTLAERAAWDYIEKEGGDMELSVINPVGVFGPILGKEQYSSSIELVVRLMNGAMPGLPDIAFGVVDVRDVADLHLRAMTDPKAKGERFIAAAGDGENAMSAAEMAKVLKERLGERAKHVPTRTVPNFLVRTLGFFDPTIKLIVGDLGKRRSSSNKKAKEVLGWEPRSREGSLVASAESLETFGMLKK
ncbi:MAG: hypothetical protein M1820_005955 [Bogoriella megaspora]|nr:MAG: hypothetical protein M1820_005955 [Bogoriella megaspora]